MADLFVKAFEIVKPLINATFELKCDLGGDVGLGYFYMSSVVVKKVFHI